MNNIKNAYVLKERISINWGGGQQLKQQYCY